MRHDIKALLGYINSTARANAVGSALNTRERRIDRLYLRIARMSETLEDFIHLRFDRIVPPSPNQAVVPSGRRCDEAERPIRQGVF